ncbi:small integral membrane protein 5 isoform X2 [Macaca fascicularis]|uniref:small integral membrane protein 5 isoform X2 n=1 Tax=Macaca fascicularis TaxID=9541 RepID=UPI003D15683A
MRCLAGHTGHSQITQDSKFSPRTPSDAEWTTNNKKARQRQQLAVSRGAGLRRPGEQRHPAPTEEVRGQHVEAPRWGTAAQPPTPELPGVSLLGYTRLCRHSANQAENARPSAEREGRKAAELLNHAPTVL